MKNHFSKKILSLVLSVLMIVTMLPTFAVTASADASEKFLMAYFTGNLQTEQQIRFAVSTDGASFKPLYGGNAVLQEKSTDTYADDTYQNTDGVRDPYIFKSPADNYYYCIATDLEATAYGFWGTQSQMVIWRSADLINWSDAYYINVAQICNSKRGTSYSNSDFQRTWAPEIFYENGQYMVYFALAGGDYQATRMHYMLTDNLMDWTHYSAPQVLYDPGYDDIDADIVKEGSTYYMFYKDETPGRSTVCLATATNMTGPYSYVAQFDTTSATGGIEGCEVYTVGSNYYLVADRFGAAGNFAIYNMGSSLAAVAAAANDGHISVSSSPVTTVEELYGFTNLTPRHGSIVHITDAEYNALVADSGGVTDTDIMYNFTTAHSQTDTGWYYSTYNDSSLHDVNIMHNNDGNTSTSKVAHDGGYITLTNANMFVNDGNVRAMFPDDVYTVSFDYSLQSTDNLYAPIFALGTGHGGGEPSADTDYVMIFGNGDCWVRKTGESSDTKVASAPLTLGVTYHYDIVSDGTNITFYRDGEQIGTIATTVDFPSADCTKYAAFGYTDGHSSAGFGYGSYSHIRFRDSAVTAATLKEEFSKKLIYNKASGNDAYGGRGSVINVSHSGDHNIVEPVVSHNSSSYTLAGWVNPGASVDYNSVIMALGNGKWTPAPSGRYFAVREDGTICFNYCSGSNSGGNWSEHFIDVTSAFTLTADEWCYLQINIVPISDNQVKLTVWKNGVQTKSQDITLTTKVDDNNTTGNDYSYGMLGFMQLPTNKMYLGRLPVPSWWQNENGTTYVQDVRFYSQAMDPANLYAAEAGEQEITSEYAKLNTVPTFNAVAYHQGDPAHRTDSSGNILEVGKGYNNVAYCTTWTSWKTCAYNTSGTRNQYDNDSGTIWNLRYKMPMPNDIVLVYDGVAAHKPASPVQAEFWSKGGWSKVGELYFQGTDIEGTNKSKFLLNEYWYGFDNDYEHWAGKRFDEDNYASKNDDWNGKLSGRDTIFDDTRHDGGTHMHWWNRLNYEGTGDYNNYYEKYENIYFGVYSTNDGNSYGNWTREHLQNEDQRIYVLNYKPVYDIVNGTTKVNVHGTNYTAAQLYTYFITNIEPNKWMYTEESIDQFYRVMYAIMHSNPNDYEFGGSSNSAANTQTDVQTCAKNIRIAATEFPQIKFVKKTFNVDYFKESGYTNETVTAGNNLASAPSLASTHYNGGDTLKHTTYAWKDDNAPSNSHMPTSDEAYTEIPTVSDCNTSGSTHVDAVGDTNGYTEHPCTVCAHNNAANNVWDDRSADWTAYNAVADTIATKAADTQYTTSSRSAYQTDCNAVTSAIETGADKSKAYIDRQKDALTTAEGKLNHVANFSALDTTVTTAAKVTARNTNNYDNSDAQIYTYSSWVNFASSFDNGLAYHNYNSATRANTPMYAVDGSGYVTSDLSSDQTNINTYNTNIGNYYNALATVGAAEKYTTFDNAKTVVEAIDTEKYTPAGIDYLNAQKSSAYNNVYKTLNSDEATLYNSLTNKSFASGSVIWNSADPDDETTALLGAVTTLDSTSSYIKHFKLTFAIQNEEGNALVDTQEINDVAYGTAYTFELPNSAALNNKSINSWGITNYDYADTEMDNAKGSSKVSGYERESLTKVVTNNMAVVATMSDDAAGTTNTKIVINDCYNQVQQVFFVDGQGEPTNSALNSASITIKGSSETAQAGSGTTVTAKELPFYSFSNWEKKADAANHVYTYTPKYTTADFFDYTFVGAIGDASRHVQYDKKIQVQFDDSVLSDGRTFKAWAVKTSGSKYQIASYNKDFYFYACAKENYVPILKNGSNYEAMLSAGNYDTLEAADIDGEIPVVANVSADNVLKQMLDGNLPFISIENTTINGDKNKIRVYARVTKGAVNVTGFGVLLRQNATAETTASLSTTNNSKKTNITNILETNQFTYTVTTSRAGGFAGNVGFKCFVNYQFSYTAAETTTSISAVDYSNGELVSIS
ncbi:MAG: hypothetical protein IKF64_03750 [Eubacterium sp.]|nr:hypothetical protein [Eubacterium sp.]